MGGHSAAGDVLTSLIVAGAGVPAAEGIGVPFQRIRVLLGRRGRHPAIEIVSVGQHLRFDLVVVLQSQLVLISRVVILRRDGWPAVGHSLRMLDLCAVLAGRCGKSRQRRARLLVDAIIVIVGLYGFVPGVVHAVLQHAALRVFIMQRGQIQLIVPGNGDAPFHIGAVVKEGQKADLAVIAVGGNAALVIQQCVIQQGIVALDGGVAVVLGVLDVELTVPSGEVGVVAPAVVIKVT